TAAIAVSMLVLVAIVLRPRIARADVLKEGDVAPPITTQMITGAQITPFSLSDYHGKRLILYFYPKDDTPGCTKEACAFRDGYAEFKKRGAIVLGVSTDSAKSHDKFVEK